MTSLELRRGDIVLTDFSPAREHEANFVRPSVVVTNDLANLYGVAITVVPLTSNVDVVHAFQILLPRSRTGLDRDSKAQVELLRGVARSSFRRVMGMVPDDLMVQLDRRLLDHLDLAKMA